MSVNDGTLVDAVVTAYERAVDRIERPRPIGTGGSTTGWDPKEAVMVAFMELLLLLPEAERARERLMGDLNHYERVMLARQVQDERTKQ